MNKGTNHTSILKLCILGILTVLFWPNSTFGQSNWNSAEILHEIKKAAGLPRVLYIAAHPDDENTRLISWLVNDKYYDVAYLSLTRGDGGQNLIGAELREKLGIIRTQELLAARRTDGAKQFFTRANDFGYSKHPAETFTIWNRETILSDVVYLIRYYQPDVIITRFPTTPGITHGHHTASAILAEEAFGLANNPKVFPEQLKEVDAWQPKALYWNTSSWFYRGESANDFDTTQLVKLEVGGYNPLIGKSYPEIASLSRSQHRSQGFGTSINREGVTEWLQLITSVDGYNNQAIEKLEQAINWQSEYKNGELPKLWQEITQHYDPLNPEASVELLLKIYKQLEKENGNRAIAKLAQVKRIIAACLGLHLQAGTQQLNVSPGEELSVDAQAVFRGKALEPMLQLINLPALNVEKVINEELKPHVAKGSEFKLTIPDNFALSQPYWLQQEGDKGMFAIESQQKLTNPANPQALQLEFQIKINNEVLTFMVPVQHLRVERSIGEVAEPLYAQPKVLVQPEEDLVVLLNGEKKQLRVKLETSAASLAGTLNVITPDGWIIEPASQQLNINSYSPAYANFTIYAINSKAESGAVKFEFEAEGKRYDKGLVSLEADHFPRQIYFPPAETAISQVNSRQASGNILYVEGAGDMLPQALSDLGYKVTQVNAESLFQLPALTEYKAIVFGIRAFNINPGLHSWLSSAGNYIAEGGIVLLQYNTVPTTFTIGNEELVLGRGRVTNELATVDMLDAKAQIWNSPNKLTKADWNNWVQERGLYFGNKWSEGWQPYIKLNDTGEDAEQGSLLIYEKGKGKVIYTGLSLFRQIPAGVPGAYRLLMNMIEAGEANL